MIFILLPHLSVIGECEAVERADSNLGHLLAQTLYQLRLSHVCIAVCPQAVVVAFAPEWGGGGGGGGGGSEDRIGAGEEERRKEGRGIEERGEWEGGEREGI